MQTLAKILLLVFWLIGAGTGWSPPDAAPAQDDIAYHVALFDGADLQVRPHHGTVQISAVWSGHAVALSASVPHWVTALSAQVHAPPATAASESPAPASSSGP